MWNHEHDVIIYFVFRVHRQLPIADYSWPAKDVNGHRVLFPKLVNKLVSFFSDKFVVV
jgi:hypothetical protein